ncbi:FAD-dependent monooxygenase [cf. Phormidesmis sp. LEGE 11477]|uniref:FAD-dependent monooxygenase n=1 Tax=cf. Phormidesmis sp. LEGE 11477 TaxID=1828680 RepID=UPI00187EF5B2|nr:FAD-dependent monooxygenase [cf. Phormidesmis sp. LEGE 11477]MBE9063157.1 FAD-dependent monooxygenase [cf. Phormidesmis sp. LEGE 11477]
MINSSEILIVGAGPVGLTMACELLRHGVSCRIIDTKTGLSDKSKALVVQARTMELFEDMGVIEDILKTGHKVSATSFYAGSDRIVHITNEDLDTHYAYNLLNPQSDTEQTLEAHLNSLGGEVEWNTKIVELDQEEKLSITLEHPDGSTSTIEPTYVIACDGAHSFCRKAVGAKLKGETFSSEFLIADLSLDWFGSKDEWYVNFTDQGLFMLAPISNNLWRMLIEVPWNMQDKSTDQQDSPETTAEYAYREEPTFEHLQEMVEQLGNPFNVKLQKPEWISYFRVHRRLIERFRYGNVFFAGDAAHLHSPAGGQGMNAGIQDAYNLAWKLALVCRGVGAPELLDSYNAERYPLSEDQVEKTDSLFHVFLLRNSVARSIRDRLASFLIGLDPVQHRLDNRLAMLSLNYRHSPIVDEQYSLPKPSGSIKTDITGLKRWRSFDDGPKAGDRAPDVAYTEQGGKPEKRLFQAIRGTAHQLILFTGQKPELSVYQSCHEISLAIQQRYGSLINTFLVTAQGNVMESNESLSILHDKVGALHQRYGARSNCLYLIRPDGYIGFRAQPATLESLMSYCDRLLSDHLQTGNNHNSTKNAQTALSPASV